MDYKLMMIAALFIAVIFGVSYLIVSKADTLPLVDGFVGASGACVAAEDAELETIISKMRALQTDLESTRATVQATLHYPLIVSHDIEQVSETAGRCMAKNVPGREIDIIFDTWNTRANELIGGLQAAKQPAAKATFSAAWNAAYDVARAKCIGRPGPVILEHTSPRDVIGVTPDVDASEYTA